MCASKPPEPKAPPPPTPQRDVNMEARRDTSSAAQRAARSGFASTLKTDPRDQSAATGGTTPILGG